MSIETGIEKMQFEFAGERPVPPFASALVGVVGSGNLEVLIESSSKAPFMVSVETSAHGFKPIWEAVLRDFHSRHALSGVHISINDMGATPAVVSLRLEQALAEIRMDTK
jgi:malonate decarboxylase delta subunit